MDERDARIADLEAQIDALAIRHSALEWIVEQHFSHYLLTQVGAADGQVFLAAISHDGGSPPWRKSEEGERSVRPDTGARLMADVRHICGKISERLRQGFRRG